MLDLPAPARSPQQHRLVRAVLDGFDFVLAEPSDAPELAKLFAAFFAEATYKNRKIVYSPERAEAWLARVADDGTCPHIIARNHLDGRIVGVISYGLDNTFCVDPVAVLHTLYILPDYRRTAIGRVLVALATETAQGDGAVAFHAPLASGMAEMKSLINLFRHAGFEEIGVIMGRSI